MKKTRPCPPSLSSALPDVLWEANGIRYPFLSGFSLKKIHGEVFSCVAGGEGETFSGIRYIRQGFSLVWDRPPADLCPSLYRLSNISFQDTYIRLWIRQGEKNQYKGYLVYVLWPASWEGEYLSPDTPFRLAFWT